MDMQQALIQFSTMNVTGVGVEMEWSLVFTSLNGREVSVER
jgi:hypothetical protein